jgi:peroxiredoxin
MKLQYANLLILLLVCVFVFANCETLPVRSLAPSIQKGDVPPDLLGQTLDGHEIHLPNFKGKVVLIIFWKSWCHACTIELQKAKVLQNGFQKNFVLVAVNMGETHNIVKTFKRRYLLDFPVLLDPQSKISSLYGIQAWPTNILINQQGQVHFVLVGSETELLRREIEKLLQNKTTE